MEQTIQYIVTQVGDSEKYGIEFGKQYNSELIRLINAQLKTEGKALIKIASDWDEFQAIMGRMIVRERQGLASGSEIKALETYFESQSYPHKWSPTYKANK